MPVNICPICRYTNVDSTGECINCGAPLRQMRPSERRAMPSFSRPGSPAADSTSLPGEIVDSTPKRQLGPTTRGRRAQAVNAEAPSSSVRPGRKSHSVAPYQGTIPAQEDENPYPYNGGMDLQPYAPPSAPFTRVQEEVLADDLEPWKTDRLPWYLPHRRPHLTGRIISMHNELEFPDYPNVLRALADLMAEFLWIAANQPAHREGERVQVTILRIRTREGGLRDARLMGYMRGADLTLGDQVSFWGWRRRGSLLIRIGYNHTSRAAVTTNMLSMLIPGLILLSLACAVFVVSASHANFGPWIDWVKHLFSR